MTHHAEATSVCLNMGTKHSLHLMVGVQLIANNVFCDTQRELQIFIVRNTANKKTMLHFKIELVLVLLPCLTFHKVYFPHDA